MNSRITAAALAVTALCALTACEGTGTSSASSKPSTVASGTSRPSAVPSATASADSDKDTGKAETAALPDMTGKGLQSAQDQAQAAGFYALTSHDASGRDRMQLFDRNWKVCSQSPGAGEHPTDTTVDFAAVKLEETCPSKDQGAKPEAAGSTMPDFKGKSVNVARKALDSSTSITVKDVSGQDRFILIESNWQVCAQKPAPGTKLDGQPVTLNAVKFGETC
ncbi:PASTA domain-containing protein [Streptomyces anandii]|uniref:PASTA domain-containing protein n=1 Tax=Streptomyces anandii TaxID=285454 RepID=UPI0037970E64